MDRGKRGEDSNRKQESEKKRQTVTGRSRQAREGKDRKQVSEFDTL